MTRNSGQPTRSERQRMRQVRQGRRGERGKHFNLLEALMELGRKVDFLEGQRILNDAFPEAARPSDIPIPEIDPERDYPTPLGYRKGIE